MRRQRAFGPFRERAFWIAVSLTLLSFTGLVLIYRYQPSADLKVRASESGKLSPDSFGVLQTLLTTMLSIGLISVLFDVLLREKYGEGLRRFLNIKTALVRSGVIDVGSADGFAWGELADATSIKVLSRDPSPWLMPHFGILIKAAERRETTILIALPDPDGARLPEIAASVGLDAQQLKSNINVSVDALRNQWKARQSSIKKGSTVRVVAYGQLPLAEIVATDRAVTCFLSKAVGHQVGISPVYLTFDDVESDFPMTYLCEPLAAIQSNNELWAGDSN